jgi:putative Mn2+ efflux pump MntP
MSTWTLLLIALGVSADAFAVALGKGLHIRRLSARDVGAIAVAFGLFQALMPVVGWLLGSRLRAYITEVDHWIAFGLLAVIGGKMLHEALSAGDDKDVDEEHIRVRELLVLSVATSIDA